MKPNEIWNYLVVVFLIHLVFCDKRGINDVIFLLANLEDEKKRLLETYIEEGQKLQFIKRIRIAKAKTGIGAFLMINIEICNIYLFF